MLDKLLPLARKRNEQKKIAEVRTRTVRNSGRYSEVFVIWRFVVCYKLSSVLKNIMFGGLPSSGLLLRGVGGGNGIIVMML